jgi:hypothetical protein
VFRFFLETFPGIAFQVRRILQEKKPNKDRRYSHTKQRANTEIRRNIDWISMPLPATISTGGAAKWVSVPPTDTLKNNNPNVAQRKAGEA